MTSVRNIVERAAERFNGIIPLEPAWVARDFLPPGQRLGCSEDQYELGPRGGISERWLASTTEADNRVKVPDEGLSFLALDSKDRLTLREAVKEAPDLILGTGYSRTHPRGLDRLAKVFDYKFRIPFHLHQRKHHAALVGRNPKEEAYYFPEGLPMGEEPETYLGVHPSIVEEKNYEILLPYLEQWNSDLILRHSKAYKLVAGDGWHIPAGILHAPGSALTIELQEDSDVFAMLQAMAGGRVISKDLLHKDVRPEDWKKHGERIILELIDWEANGDPYFYENHHTPPVSIRKSTDGEEEWIFYNTTRFSGKKLVVKAGRSTKSRDAGVYSLFVWRGRGEFDGHKLEAGKPGSDEVIVCHSKAVEEIIVKNTGREDLILFKFFGPDVNLDVPMLKQYGKKR
ncbi:MAG: hypothetical protein HYW57_07190 [Ignavibacteriales bacterium]|nr:hypothetical protein [Ignavibacteriales bacterium]